jgi:hypothetical protein
MSCADGLDTRATPYRICVLRQREHDEHHDVLTRDESAHGGPRAHEATHKAEYDQGNGLLSPELERVFVDEDRADTRAHVRLCHLSDDETCVASKKLTANHLHSVSSDIPHESLAGLTRV